MKTTINALFAAVAVAKSSPWVTNFDEKLAEVGCGNGSKQCGASNYSWSSIFSSSGQECESGKACSDGGGFWESCRPVSQWQCFRKCPPGQALNPLKYCDCEDESEIFDMFCAPLAKFGEQCSKDENCESGLSCSNGTCQQPVPLPTDTTDLFMFFDTNENEILSPTELCSVMVRLGLDKQLPSTFGRLKELTEEDEGGVELEEFVDAVGEGCDDDDSQEFGSFEGLDANHDGKLDPRELSAAMQSLGLAKTNPATFGKIQELLAANEGGISQAAFNDALDQPCPGPREHPKTFSSFEDIDANHDGKLDPRELSAAMQGLGLAKTNPATFGKIQELLDANEGGILQDTFDDALEEQCDCLSSGVVIFKGNYKSGFAVYEQSLHGLSLIGHIVGLSPGEHSVQIQVFASDDAEGACESLNDNPQGYTGDLGIVEASNRGGADLDIFYEKLPLLGNSAIATIVLYDHGEAVACGVLQ